MIPIAVLTATFLLPLSGCQNTLTSPEVKQDDGDETADPPSGVLKISASTSGQDQGEGYTATVDKSDSAEIGPNGSATFSNLDVGDHRVELSGLEPNCSDDGENPRTVSVEAETTSLTSFEITCTDGGVLSSGSEPRVFVSTDIAGQGDHDDVQSLVHFLMYADVLEIEGIISSLASCEPSCGRRPDIIEVLQRYESDYDELKAHGDYPTGQELRSVTKQGALTPQEASTPQRLSPGAQLLVEKAQESSEPLYVLLWGGPTDLAQAIHEDPSIKETIRVYWIGGQWHDEKREENNGFNSWRADPRAQEYLGKQHRDLWRVDDNTTHLGVHKPESSGELGPCTFTEKHVRGHGALGDYFMTIDNVAGHEKGCWKMGDTPTVLSMLTGDPEDPEDKSWGGSFIEPSSDNRPNYWTDDPEKSLDTRHVFWGIADGAKTVYKWRENWMRHWQKRMDRLQ